MDVVMMLAFIVGLQCLRWFPRQEDFICFICADWLSPQLRLCVTCFQKNGFIWDFRVSTNTWGGIPSPLLHIFLSHLCCISWWLFAFFNFVFSYVLLQLMQLFEEKNRHSRFFYEKNVWRQNVWGVSPLFGWLVFGRRRCFVAEAGKKP